MDKYNDRVYLSKMSPENMDFQLATTTQKTTMAIVLAVITTDEQSTFEFIDYDVKIKLEYYWENILERLLKLLANKHFICKL